MIHAHTSALTRLCYLCSRDSGATLSPKLLLLSMELPTLDEGLNTGALSEAKPNVSTQLALTSTMGNTLL